MALPPGLREAFGGGPPSRRARPRQLHVEERLPVLVVGRDKEVETLDGGAFYKWVMQHEEEAAARAAEGLPLPPAEHVITLIGSDGKPLRKAGHAHHPALQLAGRAEPLTVRPPRAAHGAWPAAGAAPSSSSNAACPAPPPSPSGAPAFHIHVPNVRTVTAAAAGARAPPVEASSAAYIRYKRPSVQELDGTVEYDMDDMDEAWLAEVNAGARRRDSLREDDLEAVLDRLEKEYFYELRRRTRANPSAAAASSAPKAAEAATESLAPADLLPLHVAQERLPDRLREAVGEARLARLHAYWLGKGRDLPAGERGEVPPLIPRLRSELEPRLLAGMSSALPPEAAADVPFQGHDPKRQQRMVDSEESYTDMLEQRDDLEVVRILSDQVRRREKLKRQLARNWLSELREELGEAAQLYTAQLEAHGLRGPPAKRPAVSEGAAGPPKRARQPPSPAPVNLTAARACSWCRKTGNCVVCCRCGGGFCYSCFRSRPGHGVKGWAGAIRNAGYECLGGCDPLARVAAAKPAASPELSRPEAQTTRHAGGAGAEPAQPRAAHPGEGAKQTAQAAAEEGWVRTPTPPPREGMQEQAPRKPGSPGPPGRTRARTQGQGKGRGNRLSSQPAASAEPTRGANGRGKGAAARRDGSAEEGGPADQTADPPGADSKSCTRGGRNAPAPPTAAARGQAEVPRGKASNGQAPARVQRTKKGHAQAANKKIMHGVQSRELKSLLAQQRLRLRREGLVTARQLMVAGAVGRQTRQSARPQD
eukprot:jgi/Tetstr1/465463/TSEL_010147.t1